MSQSEQLHDANMDEILASIRKIITDDGPEAPDADAFASAALDDFREVGAVLARSRSGGYMHDLTKALAGAPPSPPVDDDILDTETPDETYAAAEALPAPIPAIEGNAPSLDDDAELFAAELEPAVEAPLAATDADDDEIIEDLGDPIALGPEIELIDPVEVDAAPIEVGAVEPPAAAVEVATAAPAAIEAAVPPPPPPVVSALAEVQGLSAEPAELAADLSDVVEAATAEPATETGAETVIADIAPAVEEIAPVAELAAEAPALEATAEGPEVEPSIVAPEASSDPVPEAAAEASSVAATIEVAPSIGDGEPTVEAAPPSLTDPPPVPEAAPSASQPVASEDVMAAMLKPMLKEWLDTNMPGIVAKAMSGKDEPAASDT